MVGANGSFFRVGVARAGAASRCRSRGPSMLVHVDDDSVRCPSAEVLLRARRTADDHGPDRDHRRHDRRHGAALRLGVGGRRQVDGVPGGWGFLETNLNARNGQDPPGLRPGRRPDQRRHATGTVTEPAIREAAAEDRALYYRQLRATVATRSSCPSYQRRRRSTRRHWSTGSWPSSSSRRSGVDALSAEFGAEFARLLRRAGGSRAHVTAGALRSSCGGRRPTSSPRRRRARARERPANVPTARRRRAPLPRAGGRAPARRAGRGAHDGRPGRSSRRECSVTAEQLTGLPAPPAPGSPDCVVTAMEVVPGGRSKETILVSLDGTDELPARGHRAQGPPGRLAADAGGRRVRRSGGRATPTAASRCPAVLRRRDRRASWGGGTLLVMARVRRAQGGRVLPRPGRADRAPARARGAAGRRPWPTCTRCRSTTWPARASDPDAAVTDGVAHGGSRRHGGPHRPSSAGRRSPPCRWPASGCSTTSTTSCPPAGSASCRATSDCTTCSSRATASPRWSTGRRRPSARRPASWRRPGPPPPR